MPDYQAAYESAVSFMATMQAGVNFNLHTAGWLEGGLAIGYEKFVLDEDQASMAQAYIAGVDTTDNGYALDAMLAGGPGQHFRPPRRAATAARAGFGGGRTSPARFAEVALIVPMRRPGSEGSSGPYAVAKAAIMALTRQLAIELGADGVRVNCVAPGVVLSGRATRLMAAMGASAGRRAWRLPFRSAASRPSTR